MNIHTHIPLEQVTNTAIWLARRFHNTNKVAANRSQAAGRAANTGDSW